jgi:hypothetical protein
VSVAEGEKESVSLDAKRAFPFGLYGRRWAASRGVVGNEGVVVNLSDVLGAGR